MPDFFKEADLSDIRQTLQPTQSVDLSKLPQQYSRLYGEQEQAEATQRELGLNQAFRSAEQQRQQELAGISGQIGESTLGARGEFLTEPGDTARRAGLTSKEIAKTLEPELQKQARKQDLANQMFNRQVNEFNIREARGLRNFSKKAEIYSRSLSNRMSDELKAMQEKQELDYENAVERLKKKMVRRGIGSKLFGSLGGILGGIIGGVTGGPAGASAGLRIGSGATGGLFNLFSGRRNRGINF